ncbi:MAG: hypothetical protein KAG92_10975, partial [Deltaproteobacteria bacterium]|nr:hypothetical protein [Deltaproteobacteria bacterium]
MGTLKTCLKKNNVPPRLAKIIQDNQQQYIAEKYSAKDAKVNAVRDVVTATTEQHKAIVAHINEHVTKNHETIVPQDEHPAITATREELGEDVQQVDDTSERGKALTKAGEKFGKKVVFFRGREKANGFFRSNYPDTIFVNSDTEGGMLFVFGHELTHALKRDNPDLYLQLFKGLKGHVDNFDSFFDAQNKLREKQKLPPLTPMLMAEEFFADFSGEQFTDPKFWDKLMNTDKTLFAKLVELFQEIFNQSFNHTGTHFRAVNKAQDALAKVLKQYAIDPKAAAD